MLKCKHVKDSVILNGQISLKPFSCMLPTKLGKCQINIKVNYGYLRLNHLAFNVDGATWSSPPGNWQQAHYNLNENSQYNFTINIGSCFDKPDRIEIVNLSMFKNARFSYEIK